jgi:hypothetical protein
MNDWFSSIVNVGVGGLERPKSKGFKFSDLIRILKFRHDPVHFRGFKRYFFGTVLEVDNQILVGVL